MFKETVEKYYPEMKAIREDLHRHPELSYKEERTSALIMEKLKEYGVDSVERTWMTGLVALIKGGKGEGKCIAIRADMDALPVTEETGVEFASENEGVMHACGHDMHITILLTAAYSSPACFRRTATSSAAPTKSSSSPPRKPRTRVTPLAAQCTWSSTAAWRTRMSMRSSPCT